MSITVISLPSFEKSIKKLFSKTEKAALVEYLLLHPDADDVIPGTGGIRKLRWAAKGKGKRGGARVIYFHFAVKARVYLMKAYAKNEKEDLTSEEKEGLKASIEIIQTGGING